MGSIITTNTIKYKKNNFKHLPKKIYKRKVNYLTCRTYLTLKKYCIVFRQFRIDFAQLSLNSRMFALSRY